MFPACGAGRGGQLTRCWTPRSERYGGVRLTQRRYPRGHAPRTESNLSASRPACQILRAEDGSCDLGRHGSFLMQQISSQAHLRGISAGAA